MNKKEDFQSLINLLSTSGSNNVFITELLAHYANSPIHYDGFEKTSLATTKDHILGVYELRGQMEDDRKEKFVFGYEDLLPALRQTPHPHICISIITSTKGSYIIFTDFGKTDLIGVLKSSRTL